MNPGRLARMPAERRRLLVDVAAAEFTSAGYEQASLNRIITRCGMSKSSFYYVLSSKAELYEFVVRELLADVTSEFPVTAAEEFDGEHFWERLEDYFGSVLAAAQADARFQLLGRMFYLPGPANTAATGVLEAVREWVRDVLRTGRRCGAVRTDLPEGLQADLVFRILQIFDEWTVAHYPELSAAEVAELSGAQFATIRRTLAP